MALNGLGLLAAAAAALCCGTPLWAQPAPETGDRRLAAARGLETAGQLDAARQLYREIAASSPASDAVPEALLSLARLTWPVDDPSRLGREPLPAALALEVRAHLDMLRTRFDRTPQAAEALWRLALLELEPTSSQYDPADATAQLRTLSITAPHSPRVPAALLLAAETESLNGRLPQAAAIAFSLLADHPGAVEHCSGAWRVLADVDSLGSRFGEALSELGRAAVCGTDQAAAERARDHARLLGRHVSRSAGAVGAPAVELPITLTVRDPQLLVDRDGVLWASSSKDDVLIGVRRDRIVERVPLPGGVASSFDRWNRRWSIVGERVFAPAGAGDYPLPDGTEPISIAPVDARAVWIADADTNRVIRLAAGGKIDAAAALPVKAEPSKLIATPGGGVWVLDQRSPGALHQVASSGALVRTVSLVGVAARVIDIAIDALGTLYLLDGKETAVVVISPEGRLLQRLVLPQQGDAAVNRPTALAVDRDGSIAIYDSKRGKILWLR